MRALPRSETDHAINNVTHLQYRPHFDSPSSLDQNETAPMLIWETDDIVIARHVGRRLGEELGCSDSKIALLTTAISELARNIILYAKQGEISVSQTLVDNAKAIQITAKDDGPGIADVDSALAGGYSTSGGLGLGLSGLNQIADMFEVNSNGAGTCVKVAFQID